MTRRQGSDGVYPGTTARLQAEQDFYSRFFKFALALMCLFGVMSFAELEHSSYLFYAGILGLGLYLAYMISMLVYTIFVVNGENGIRNILTDEELAEMDRHDNEEERDAANGAARMAMYPLEETPHRIRSCQEEISYFRPKSGRYNVVYNAVFFGKSVRSESQLILRFEEAPKSNGWELSGTVISGSKQKCSQTRRPISEGFVNARGEMYWKLANPHDEVNLDGVYRGCYDFRSSTMYDGEFQAGSAPQGRIVRMELVEELEDGHNEPLDDWGSSDWGTADIDAVELVRIDKAFV